MYGYQQQQQQVPLPPGWEAKYDQGNQKWYFINHLTKKTQWTDPRVQTQQPQQAYQQQNSYAQRQQQQQQAEAQRRQQQQAEAQRKAQLEAQRRAEAEAKRRSQIEAQRRAEAEAQRRSQLEAQRRAEAQAASSSAQSDTNWLETMKQFGLDSNTMNLVKEMVENNKDIDLEGTLTDMGIIKQSKPQTPVTRQAVEEVKPQLTPNQKLQMKEKMMQKFPKLTSETVRMSLEAAEYDADIAEALLISTNEAQEKKAKKSKPKTTTPKAEPKKPEAPRTFAPVVFGAEETEDKPKPKDKPKPTTSTTSSLTVVSSSSVSSEQRPRSPRAPTPNRTMERKKVMPSAKKHRSRSPLPPVSTTTNAYVSKLRCKPTGPNPANCVGADPALLGSTYAKASGPDRKNYQGPSRTNYQGPQISNCCGRDINNCQGRAGLNVGSMIAV